MKYSSIRGLLLLQNVVDKGTEIRCQNLFNGRIVKSVLEIIILFVLFLPSPLKYIYQVSEKTLFLSAFHFLGLEDSRFQEIRSDTFSCFLELWGLLFITFGKSSNKAPLQQINRIRSPTLIRGRRLLQNF